MRGRILRLLLSMTAVFLLSACTGPEKEADSRAERFDTRTEQFLKYARQYGLIESDEYSDLEAQLEKENEQREGCGTRQGNLRSDTVYHGDVYKIYMRLHGTAADRKDEGKGACVYRGGRTVLL